MGLSSAVALDIIVTAALSYYLRKSKSGFSRCGQLRASKRLSNDSRSMNQVVDTLILYTVETGSVTWYVLADCVEASILTIWKRGDHCLTHRCKSAPVGDKWSKLMSCI